MWFFRRKPLVSKLEVQDGGKVVIAERIDHLQLTSISIASSDPISIPHQLPSPPVDFVGRDELLQDLENLAIRTMGFLISGMAGSGKTVFALKLAEHLKSRYPDGQFYLDLAGTGPKPLSLRTIMVHVISSFSTKQEIPKRQSELAGLYRTVLDNKKVLLLFDNARDATQIDSLFPSRSSTVIATSRNYFAIPGFTNRSLGPLAPQEAHTLLRRMVPRLGNETDKLAEVCGYLPLALRFAGGVLASRRDMTPEEYLEQLAENPRKRELVDKSLRLSYTLLDDCNRELWRVLSVFREAFDVSAAAAIWNLDLPKTREHLSEILTRSMIDWDEQTKRYRLHDLARLFADNETESSERATVALRHSVYYERVSRSAYDVIVSRGRGSIDRGFEMLYSDWVNIVAGQAWAAAHIDGVMEAARLCRDYATRSAFFHLLKTDPAELIRWMEAAIKADKHLADKQAEATDSSLLGYIQMGTGNVKSSVDWHKKALVLSRTIADRRTEAEQLQRLMDLYALEDGQTQKAIEHGEAALLIHKELGNRIAQGEVLDKLAGLLSSTGRIAENSRLISYYKQAAEIFHALNQTNDEGRILLSLSLEYRNAGDHLLSIQMAKDAAKIFRQLRDRKQEAIALMQVGTVYMGTSESEGALDYAEKSLAIARELSLQDLIKLNLGILLSVHGQLGRVDLVMKDVPSAVKHFKRQLSAAKELRALGDSMPQYMDDDALLALGMVFLKQKKSLEAKTYLIEGLQIARSTSNREREAEILDVLGLALFSLGDRTGAIKQSEAALRIFEDLGSTKARLPLEHLAHFMSI